MKKQEKELWLKLYEEAFKLEELEPWNYYYDNEPFYVESDNLPEGYFCSIMGKSEGHTAISIYTMAQMPKYFELEKCAYNIGIVLNYQDCLICNFLTEEETLTENVEIINELGIKFPNSYISFDCFEEGYMPYKISIDDVVIMTEVFKELIELLNACIKKKLKPKFEDGYYPSRINGVNKNTKVAIPIPEYPIYKVDPKVIDKINALKETKNVYEIEFLNYFSMAIEELNDGRYRLPIIRMVLDRVNAKCINIDLADISKFKDKEDYFNSYLELLYKIFKENGKPKTIYVRDDKTYFALSEFADETGIKLKSSSHLLLDNFYNMMFEDLGHDML